MRSFIRTFLQAGIPYGLIMSVFFIFESGALVGVIRGIIWGTLFGLAMAFYSRYRTNEFRRNPRVFTDEETVQGDIATHSTKWLGSAGSMYLTDKYLHFVGDTKRNRPHEVAIPIYEIEDARAAKSFGIFRNRLNLKLSDHPEESFIVDEAAVWANEITQLRQAYLDQPRSDEARLFA